jgi:hypothetical protein
LVAVARFLGADVIFCHSLLWGSRPPRDAGRPLEFYRRDARNRPQGFETVRIDGAGKDTNPGQGGVRPKPESSAGVSHLAHSFEGVVSDGNGYADLHGNRSGRPNESGTDVPGVDSILHSHSLIHGFFAPPLPKLREARHYQYLSTAIAGSQWTAN